MFCSVSLSKIHSQCKTTPLLGLSFCMAQGLLLSAKRQDERVKKARKNIAKHGLNQEKYCNFVEKDNETKT